MNKTKSLNGSTARCVEKIYTAFTNRHKLYFSLLQIIESHLLIKSNFYLIKTTLQNAKRINKQLLYKKEINTAPLNITKIIYVVIFSAFFESTTRSAGSDVRLCSLSAVISILEGTHGNSSLTRSPPHLVSRSGLEVLRSDHSVQTCSSFQSESQF